MLVFEQRDTMRWGPGESGGCCSRDVASLRGSSRASALWAGCAWPLQVWLFLQGL